MVLTVRAAPLALLLALSACLPKVPLQRLPTKTPVTVAYVVDPQHLGDVASAPDAVKQAVAQVLAERNLEPAEVPLAALGGQRLTDARLDALLQAPGDAPLVVLVEARAQFFSQLDGRYRWEVGLTLSAARRGGAKAQEKVELPVVLQFDHEREAAAVSAAADEVAARLGTLLDGLLVQPTPAPRSALPRSIYFVMVDRFANGDRTNDGEVSPDDPQAFHGGDLLGVQQRLGWLEELGVDAVWLSPIFAMRTEPWHGFGAFHGYWTWRLDRLEPRFGTDAQLRALADALHGRGMKLLLDVVINHVGPDAPLLAERPGWFHRRGGITDFGDPEQLVLHDVHGLPDLASEQPEVLDFLVRATRRWLRAGPG